MPFQASATTVCALASKVVIQNIQVRNPGSWTLRWQWWFLSFLVKEGLLYQLYYKLKNKKLREGWRNFLKRKLVGESVKCWSWGPPFVWTSNQAPIPLVSFQHPLHLPTLLQWNLIYKKYFFPLAMPQNIVSSFKKHSIVQGWFTSPKY